MNGSVYTVVTLGPYAGQVFQVNQQTSTLNNVTGSVNIQTVTAATSTVAGIYRLDSTTFNGQTGAVIADTAAPSPPAAASSAGSGGAGGSLLIIVIVVLVIVILAVVLLVVIKKKNQKSESDSRNAAAVSFENPMVCYVTCHRCPAFHSSSLLCVAV